MAAGTVDGALVLVRIEGPGGVEQDTIVPDDQVPLFQ